MKATDLSGMNFGRLTVIRVDGKQRRYNMWRCDCSCGGTTVVRHDHLTGGKIYSCGCARDGSAHRTHGQSSIKTRSSEYSIWCRMLRRCNKPQDKCFHYYGGRGIVVSPSWHSFEGFFADMGVRPSLSHSLERKDNNGPYSKENCKWATKIEQANNKRSNARVDILGVTKTVAEWKREMNIESTITSDSMRKIVSYCLSAVDQRGNIPNEF